MWEYVVKIIEKEVLRRVLIGVKEFYDVVDGVN